VSADPEEFTSSTSTAPEQVPLFKFCGADLKLKLAPLVTICDANAAEEKSGEFSSKDAD
jgi:hypothetical protein